MKSYKEEIEKIKGFQTRGGYLYEKFYKKISPYMVHFLNKLKITPHQVTFLGFLFDVLAGILILFLDLRLFFIPAFLIFMAYLMDGCDGLLARYTKNLTKYGCWLDENLGITGQVIVLISIIFRIPFTEQNVLLGIFAIFGVIMALFAAVLSERVFEKQKANISNAARQGFKLRAEKFLGITINPLAFSFSADIQRTLTAILLIINPYYVLWLFAIFSNLFWLVRFWIYRSK